MVGMGGESPLCYPISELLGLTLIIGESEKEGAGTGWDHKNMR